MSADSTLRPKNVGGFVVVHIGEVGLRTHNREELGGHVAMRIAGPEIGQSAVSHLG
jgi:hypothetical protein